MARIMGRSIRAMETAIMIRTLLAIPSKTPGTIPITAVGINPTAAEIMAGHSQKIILRKITVGIKLRTTTAAGRRILPTTRMAVTTHTSSITTMEDHGTAAIIPPVGITTTVTHPVAHGTAAITHRAEDLTAGIHQEATAPGVVTHQVVVAVDTVADILPVEALTGAEEDTLPVEVDSVEEVIHLEADSVAVAVEDILRVAVEATVVTGKKFPAGSIACQRCCRSSFIPKHLYLHFT